MPTLEEIREQYPQYKDMSDKDLADGVYNKYYTDMPREQFDQKLGIKHQAPAADHPASWFERQKQLMVTNFQEQNVGMNQIANQIGLGPTVGKISQALGGPPQASPEKLADLGQKLNAQHEKVGPVNNLMDFVKNIPGETLNPIGMLPVPGGPAAREGANLVTKLLTGAGRAALKGTEQGTLQGAVAPSGDKNQTLEDRATHAGKTGLVTGAANVGLAGAGAAGKSIAKSLTGNMGGKISDAAAAALAKITKTAGGPFYDQLQRMGVKLKTNDTADVVQKKLVEGHENYGESILNAVAPDEIGPSRAGKVSPITVGEDFTRGYQTAKAAEQRRWAMAEARANKVTLTNKDIPESYIPQLQEFQKALNQNLDADKNLNPVVNHINKMFSDMGIIPEDRATKLKPGATDVENFDYLQKVQARDTALANRKIPVAAVVELNKIINETFKDGKYVSRKDVPYAAIKSLNDDVIAAGEKKDPQFAEEYRRANETTMQNAERYKTDVLQGIGLDAKVIQSIRAVDRGRPLNLDAKEQLIKVVHNIKDEVQLEAIGPPVLSQHTFNLVARAKLADIMAEGTINPKAFEAHRELINEILSLTGKDKQLTAKITNYEQLATKLQGLREPIEGMSDEAALKSAKKGLLGLFTGHYAFAASQMRDVLAPPLKADAQKLLNIGKQAFDQRPAAAVKQGLSITIHPLLQNVPSAAVGNYLGRNPKAKDDQ